MRAHMYAHTYIQVCKDTCVHTNLQAVHAQCTYTHSYTLPCTHIIAYVHTQIPYTVKLSSGKTFAVFQPIMKVFPLIHLLCTVHDGHGLMSFPVNSVFYAQPRKFSHSKVLPYTVRIHMSILRMCSCGVNLWLDCHSYLPLHLV